jgi:hypothetical protein
LLLSPPLLLFLSRTFRFLAPLLARAFKGLSFPFWQTTIAIAVKAFQHPLPLLLHALALLGRDLVRGLTALTLKLLLTMGSELLLLASIELLLTMSLTLLLAASFLGICLRVLSSTSLLQSLLSLSACWACRLSLSIGDFRTVLRFLPAFLRLSAGGYCSCEHG